MMRLEYRIRLNIRGMSPSQRDDNMVINVHTLGSHQIVSSIEIDYGEMTNHQSKQYQYHLNIHDGFY